LKTTVNLHDFRKAFHDCGRGSQFSHEALETIFEWIEQNEEDEGREWELDVIALCCELSEMTINEIIDAYDLEIDPDQNIYMQVADYISDNSTFIGDTPQGTFIFVQF